MSRIEQLISEIEEYIDTCKYQALSNTRIIVNKEELEELLVELRLRVPDEIKKYQKIISNQDIILSEARSQADSILAEATAHTDELVNEHEIMQKAYSHAQEVVDQSHAQADEIVGQANAQAQAIIDNAVNEANAFRQSSILYMDDSLKNFQSVLGHTMEGTQSRFEAFMSSMQSTYDVVSANRSELTGDSIVSSERTLEDQM